MVLISFVINSLVKVLYLWIYNSSGNDSLIYLSLFVDAVTRTLTRVLTLLVCMGYSSPAGITPSLGISRATVSDVTVRVVVFAGGTAADAAREAGADAVGMDDLLEKVKGGWLDFDVVIATPEAMANVRKLARVLGPRGLMPNPKTGTVTDDTATAVQQQKAGKVEFRMDRQGNICVMIGKLSFDADKLVENAKVLLDAIRGNRPAALKGQLFRKVSVSSTMGVPVKLDIKD